MAGSWCNSETSFEQPIHAHLLLQLCEGFQMLETLQQGQSQVFLLEI